MPPNPQAATVPTAYSAVVIPRSLRRRTVRSLDMEPPGAGSRPVRAPPQRGCFQAVRPGPTHPMGDVPTGDEGRITAAAVDGGLALTAARDLLPRLQARCRPARRPAGSTVRAVPPPWLPESGHALRPPNGGRRGRRTRRARARVWATPRA